MAITPDWLDGVATNQLELQQPKCLRSEGTLGGSVNIAHHVRFPLATCTRAGTAELLERNERLTAIVPADGEFVADRLQVQGPHTGNRYVRAGGKANVLFV